MTIATLHPQLLGHWLGHNQLWMSPAEPPLASASTMTVASTVQGKFITLAYTWAFEGKSQDGLLLVGDSNSTAAASAAWVDSFHQSGQVMHCTGSANSTGFTVTGSYAAPPGPDWGWCLSVMTPADDELVFEMHNIPPSQAPELAVRAVYKRV